MKTLETTIKWKSGRVTNSEWYCINETETNEYLTFLMDSYKRGSIIELSIKTKEA